MQNFWDYSVWGPVNLVAVLLGSLLIANAIKKIFRPLRNSLVPTSVFGGLLLLAVIIVYNLVTGDSLLDTRFFGGNGSSTAEILMYHCLALGFIATVFKPEGNKLTRERTRDIFNTGVTTVSTYLIQAIAGLGITLVWAVLRPGFFEAAGILLPFGYGQGTGQALNYGGIYETDYGFSGGRSFGLTIAALGFLSASIGGIIHLTVMSRRGKLKRTYVEMAEHYSSEDVQKSDEIPMNGSIDKLTVQLGFVFLSYVIAYLIIFALGELAPGLKSVLYGFNFLFGVIIATIINTVLVRLKRKKAIRKEYINAFLMKRISGFFFDLMIVAGIAAIKIDVLRSYWGIMIILGTVGAVITYIYNRVIAHVLFRDYEQEQFLAMYGMLTGTASTGIILLREIDNRFETPVADNLVYQNFPAIVFGFPMMLLAALAPKQPIMTLVIVVGFFAVMNLILFRRQIFCRKDKKNRTE